MAILRKALLPFLSLSLLLQASEPPADVDAALRSRVTEFYQLAVAKKFRLAEEMLASDTKDFYYNAAKPNILAFSIKSIQYGPNFQQAAVTLTAKMVMMMGGSMQGVDVPYANTWKIEDGKWCLYIDPKQLLETPFGIMHVDNGATGADVIKMVDRLKQAGAGTMNGVHANPTHIPLDPGNPKPQVVTLQNTLAGPVTVESVNPSSALKVEIAKANLAADESTQVTITPVAGSSDHPAAVSFKISPLGQIVTVALDYP